MKKAFVFPGQGSQIVGMGKIFYDNFDIAKKVFEEVNEALSKDLSKIIFEGPIDVLSRTDNTQPALMCISIAILKVLEEKTGKKINELCSYVAGHSLGEYTALCAAGSITLSDTAKLLKVRGESFFEAGEKQGGSMLALLGVTLEQVEELISKSKGNNILQIANDNTVGQIVLSGENEAIDRAITIAQEMGIKKAVKLATSGAFHSKLMEPAKVKMEEALNNTEVKTPLVPVFANVTAETVSDPKQIKENLLTQISSVVRWRETMLNMEKEGIEEIVEIGSGKVLGNMVPRTLPDMKKFSIFDLETFEEYLNNL